MPSYVQKQFTSWGLTKQSAKGSPVATPSFVGGGVMGGQVITSAISSSYDSVTLPGAANDRFAPNVYRTQVLVGASFQLRMTPKAISSLLYAALGTNAGASTTHTSTPAAALNYYSLMAQFGGVPEGFRLSDAKLDSLKVSVKGSEPVTLDLNMVGATPGFDFGAWTSTNDETGAVSMTPVGGTFLLDTNATPAATAITMTGLDLEIKNNIQPVFGASSISPSDVVESQQEVTGSCTLIIPDLNTTWQSILTGTTGGTTISAVPVYGAFSYGFTDGTNTVTLSAPRVEFICDFPTSDPKGGPTELPVTFRVARAAAAAASFSAVVVNSLTGIPS